MNNIENSVCLKGFGEFIKEGREKKSLYQEQIAQQLEISQTYYSLIERGERNVDLVLAMKICQALNLDLSQYIKTYMK